MDVWLNTNYGGYMIYSNNFVSKYRNILKIQYSLMQIHEKSVVAGIYLYCGLQVIHVSGYWEEDGVFT